MTMEKPKKLNINEWALEDRPREKMMQKGIRALSNAELIAILIGSGNKNETAVELAQRILNGVDNRLNRLSKLGVADLSSAFEGIGQAKAISIIAALELGRRRKSEEAETRKQITCSRDIYEWFYPLLVDQPHEEFWIALLNASNKIIDQLRVGQGGVSFTPVDVRMVMKAALRLPTTGIVLCHNHPSNNRTPSRADIELTRKIKEAAIIFDIRLLDHIVFCEDGYYSFADEGVL